MATKLRAAKTVTSVGGMLVLADGKPASLSDILRGEVDGTVFKPSGDGMDHRKRWIAHAIKEMGTLEVDAGAARALTEQGRSLLPAGIVGCEGSFTEGDPVVVMHRDQRDRQRAEQLFGRAGPSDHGQEILGDCGPARR